MRIVALSLVLLLAACAPAAAPARDSLAGVYKVGGGDASIEIVKALTEAFAAKHPGVKFELDTSLGSDPAVKLAADGSLDLGMASRELTADELKIVDRQIIGAAGTAIAVHAQNPVRSLSSVEVGGIFSGKVTDWSALGGERLAITPLIREKGSSARTTFENVIFGGKPAYAATVLEIVGGDQMRQNLASQRASVGIIGVTSDDPEAAGVRIVTIDGVLPTKVTLRDGTYTLRRPLYLLVTKTGTRKAAIVSFLEFVNAPEGLKIMERF
jgi:phosphate transport system substrate-binding protein